MKGNDKDKSLNSYYYSEHNVSKCRDLILEDLGHLGLIESSEWNKIVYTIKKRFGDLECKEDEVQKHTIDKQRVKEVIEQEIHHVYDTEFNYVTTRDYLLKILKRLGLE